MKIASGTDRRDVFGNDAAKNQIASRELVGAKKTGEHFAEAIDFMGDAPAQ